MCVIITKCQGIEPLPIEYFENAWDSNSHGAGIVWKEGDNTIQIRKGYMTKDIFLDKIKEINKKETAYIIHCRIASKGAVSVENCHPFKYENITFAHNGTLSITPTGNKTDTETFGDKFFTKITLDDIIKNKDIYEYAIGYSKFAFMDNNTGEIFILNKELGEEKDNCWFSNSSAFPKTNIITSNNYYNYYNNTNKTQKNISDNDTKKETNTPLWQEDFFGTDKFNINRTGVYWNSIKNKFINSITQTEFLYDWLNKDIVSLTKEGFIKLNKLDESNLFEDKYFDKEYGKSLYKYIQKERINAFKELKKETNKNDYDLSKLNCMALFLVENTIHKIISKRIYSVDVFTLDLVLFNKDINSGLETEEDKLLENTLLDIRDIIIDYEQTYFGEDNEDINYNNEDINYNLEKII